MVTNLPNELTVSIFRVLWTTYMTTKSYNPEQPSPKIPDIFERLYENCCRFDMNSHLQNSSRNYIVFTHVISKHMWAVSLKGCWYEKSGLSRCRLWTLICDNLVISASLYIAWYIISLIICSWNNFRYFPALNSPKLTAINNWRANMKAGESRRDFCIKLVPS